jgi:hypothetical protein
MNWSACPLLGEGNNLESIFAHQPCGRSVRPCISSSGFRFTTPSQDAGIVVLSLGDGILTHLLFMSPNPTIRHFLFIANFATLFQNWVS